jgi:hypothetical protein
VKHIYPRPDSRAGNRAGKTRLTYEVACYIENPPGFTAIYTSKDCACGRTPSMMIMVDVDYKNRTMTYEPQCEECYLLSRWFKQTKSDGTVRLIKQPEKG